MIKKNPGKLNNLTMKGTLIALDSQDCIQLIRNGNTIMKNSKNQVRQEMVAVAIRTKCTVRQTKKRMYPTDQRLRLRRKPGVQRAVGKY